MLTMAKSAARKKAASNGATPPLPPETNGSAAPSEPRITGASEIYTHSLRIRLSDGSAIDIIPCGLGSIALIPEARQRLLQALKAML